MLLQDVGIRYSRRSEWILRDVTVRLEPGSVAVVLGRNGAGKSTLLSAVAGVLPIGQGTILDRPRVIGWVPERFPAAQPFTARDYLLRVGRVRGLSRSSAAAALARWAELLHLTPFLDTRLSQLSKGSAQKVGLTQALLVPPGLLVLDEPWEGLDAQTTALVPQIIDEVTAAGGAALVSDHRGEAVRLAGAARWLVTAGTVTPSTMEVDMPPRCVIEIAVDAEEASAVAARLRAEGHDVVAVRR
jgi:ABC-2 type transport system ATP-binding protein